VLTNAPSGVIIDHKNGNGLDNRQSNLRFCDYKQNNHNSKMRSDNTSGKKGVTWSKAHQRWRVKIKAHGKHIHLGLFTNLDEASAAYECAAERYFGEFARF
jgi:hypothetical protein